MPACSSHLVALAFGTNLGDPAATAAAAVGGLLAAGLAEPRLSDLFATRPVDCLPGTPPFVNGAVVGEWPGTPHDLLRTCQRLETAAGRPANHSRQEARALDLDILLFDQLVLTLPELILPHPRLATRMFVLAPLAQIAPLWPVPGLGRTVEELLERAEQRSENAEWGRRIGGPPMPGMPENPPGQSGNPRGCNHSTR